MGCKSDKKHQQSDNDHITNKLHTDTAYFHLSDEKNRIDKDKQNQTWN